MGSVLHVGASIQCPHGGSVSVSGGDQRVKPANQAAATMASQMSISACPFTVGPTPQPCVLTRWIVPAKRVRAGGQPLLLQVSTGLTQSAAQAPQGTPTIASVQARVKGQ